MLSLDSDQWTELTDAYGPASNIPRLIREAAVEPWDELRCRVILGCVAAAKGHSRLSQAIEELEPEVIEKLLDQWIFE